MMKAAMFVTGGAIPESYLFSAALKKRPSNSKPNIIFIFADQMRSHVLGCYGNKQVKTKNIDKMARKGVRFDNAISIWPVCSPFRAMLLTGMYPMNNGTVANDTPVYDNLPTIGKICKQNGYETGYIGKWHLESNRDPFVPKNRRQGFDYWAVRNCSHKYFNSYYCADTPEKINLPGYETVAQTDLAINYIDKNKDKPFCLFMSWGPPHNPYKAPEEYHEKYPPEDVVLRKNVQERVVVDDLLATDKSDLSEKTKRIRKKQRTKLDSDEEIRKMIAGYYAQTEVLDDCMGRIIEKVDKSGLKENTIIVFSSDHGDMLGSHRMALKQMPMEESISIPFIIRYPNIIPANTSTDALLGTIDMMPTLLGLAGLPVPKGLDGKDISQAARGKNSGPRKELFIMKMVPGGGPYMANAVREWRGVRTKEYTYARLLERGPWLLYHNKKDPFQLTNLVNDPSYKKIRDQLDKSVDRLAKEAKDSMKTEIISAFKDERKKSYSSSADSRDKSKKAKKKKR